MPREKFVKLEMPWSTSAQPARPASRPAPRRMLAVASATGRGRLAVAGGAVGDRIAVPLRELPVVDLRRVAPLVGVSGAAAHLRHLGGVCARPADPVGEV